MLEIQGIRVEGGTKKETYIGPDAYPIYHSDGCWEY